MASLNTSSNGPNITRSYQNVVNAPPPSGPQASSPTYGQWAVFAVAAPLVSAFQGDGGKESVLKVQSTGGTWNQPFGQHLVRVQQQPTSVPRALYSMGVMRDPLFSGQARWRPPHTAVNIAPHNGLLTKCRG
jgi:hypothetical protein